MATSGMSYAVHYELVSHTQDSLLQDFSRMRIRTPREQQPVLYVAMATWIPKCNMYHHNDNTSESSNEKSEEIIIETTINNEIEKNDENKPSDNKNEELFIADVEKDDNFDINMEVEEDVDTKINIISGDTDTKQIVDISKQLDSNSVITPQRVASPRQLAKKMESEKKRQQRQQERDERDKEKERIRLEKLKQKQEKQEQKQKEIESKLKEKEMKEEQKRKEKEERELKRKEKEDQKRKEKEQEKLKKQLELEEKNKEKQKQEEQKQKAAAAFVNFFVPKKLDFEDRKIEENISSIFMPFEIKSDMRLAPARRPPMTDDEKIKLMEYLENPEDKSSSYLKDITNGKCVRRGFKTWPFEEPTDDSVTIVEEDSEFGESICDDVPKMQKMRVKFLKFHDNRRPPYFGTWRKKSRLINARKPFATDRILFDYEVDSDDDWEEEEEQGESLNGSDDEDKDNELENDDYEVDNEFFVPHGHLSDDEIDDESTSKLSPELLKQKLKLLKDEFDQDMQSKTHKIKPRSIGCIWYNKNGTNVDEAIDRHLQSLAMITNGQIIIKKCVNNENHIYKNYKNKELHSDLIPAFLKLIHGNFNKKKTIVLEFIAYMSKNGYEIDISKANLLRCLKKYAQYKKCTEDGPLLNKFCWLVNEDVRKQYHMQSLL